MAKSINKTVNVWLNQQGIENNLKSVRSAITKTTSFKIAEFLHYKNTNGLVQCDRLIIEDCGLTDAYMKRVIRNRVANGQPILEIWVSGKSTPLYKKLEE